MIDSLNLAKYVIYVCNQKDVEITNLKLQRILYFIYGTYAGAFSFPLFVDRIEAWQLGPVVHTAYVEYCSHGSLSLYLSEAPTPLDCDEKEMDLINFVINNKIHQSGRELIISSINTDPWKNHKNEIEDKPIISFYEIQTYFKDSKEVAQWKEHYSYIERADES